MNFDKESKSEEKKNFFFWGGGGGGGGGREGEGVSDSTEKKNDRYSLIFLCSCSI